jgi:hypothetical protein
MINPLTTFHLIHAFTVCITVIITIFYLSYETAYMEEFSPIIYPIYLSKFVGIISSSKSI